MHTDLLDLAFGPDPACEAVDETSAPSMGLLQTLVPDLVALHEVETSSYMLACRHSSVTEAAAAVL